MSSIVSICMREFISIFCKNKKQQTKNQPVDAGRKMLTTMVAIQVLTELSELAKDPSCKLGRNGVHSKQDGK